MYKRVVQSNIGLPRTSILPSIFAIGGGVIGMGNYIKNTFLLKQYERKIQLHDDNGPVKPSVKLGDLVTEVSKDLGESISEHTYIRPILISGTRTIRAGTVGTHHGGVIGLPYFFECTKKEEIDGKIQWDETSANAEEIYNAFLLSDEAKKYGIAREILLVNTYQMYVDVLIAVTLPFLFEKLSTNAKIQSDVLNLPLHSRSLFYVLFVIFGIVMWRYLHISLQKHYENEAESTISELGEDYIRGGVEYNSKIIQRNLYSATMKNQDNRILQHLSNLMKFLFSPKEVPSQTLQFYKHLTKRDEELKENYV